MSPEEKASGRLPVFCASNSKKNLNIRSASGRTRRDTLLSPGRLALPVVRDVVRQSSGALLIQ
eukprot:scaffold32188_cov101-Isochrysis_galbana.AAC.1